MAPQEHLLGGSCKRRSGRHGTALHCWARRSPGLRLPGPTLRDASAGLAVWTNKSTKRMTPQGRHPSVWDPAHSHCHIQTGQGSSWGPLPRSESSSQTLTALPASSCMTCRCHPAATSTGQTKVESLSQHTASKSLIHYPAVSTRLTELLPQRLSWEVNPRMKDSDDVYPLAPGLIPLRPVTAHLGGYQVRKGGCGSGEGGRGGVFPSDGGSWGWVTEGGQVQGEGGEKAESGSLRAN